MAETLNPVGNATQTVTPTTEQQTALKTGPQPSGTSATKEEKPAEGEKKEGKKRVSLLEAMALKNNISLVFQLLKVETSAADKNFKIATLQLADPIPVIISSQRVPNSAGALEEMRLEEVEFVKIGGEDLADEGFDMEVDEDGTVLGGTYKGSGLSFDIAKSTGDAWLVSETFAAKGSQMRNAGRNERLKNTWSKMSNKG